MIYVIWKMSDRTFTLRLLLCKQRLNPIFGTTIPRGELQSLTILMQLIVFILEASSFSP